MNTAIFLDQIMHSIHKGKVRHVRSQSWCIQEKNNWPLKLGVSGSYRILRRPIPNSVFLNIYLTPILA